MRVMFLLLVLVNLLFFGWANWVDRPAARVRTAAVVPSLQLAPSSAKPQVAVPNRCRSLGPYADESGATAAGAALTQRGLAARARRVDSASADGYWVYVVAADQAQQRRVLRELARAGISDAAAVKPEAGAGRVSAGIFSEQKGAEERAAAVRRAGLEPVLETRQKSMNTWWLDITLPATQADPRPDDAELGGAGSALQLTECQG